ncbi:MAG: FAD-binding oxidoreductase [Kiritimatiellales bacterium]|nr:FAD-binding oxidoreductase [Kiritimatiellales bacterium]MCF7863856.1 FAD-binding oxidoreductase [Kiritimatiellales bacterium]
METFPPVAAAIDAWKAALGADAVIDDHRALERYTRSVCATTRQVVAVLKPTSLEAVQHVVATANAHKVPLYPISCGKQWGMGSRLPVKDGAAIVDLGGMNRIIEVNAQYHYAVVEPGVTQRQLLDHIKRHDLPLMLNVTGSTSDTSLIGNAMDRGVGYFDSRAHGISNMQVVLGNGETIQTGFGHYANATTKNLYHHGIGPSLDGLFQQANFGIVTAACIDLMPKPDSHLAAIIKIDSEDKLPQLIDALGVLRTRGVFLSVAHVGNRERSYITLAPLLYEQLVQSGEPAGEATRNKAVKMLEDGGFGPWSAAIGILGTAAQIKLAKKEIRKAAGGFAKTMFLNDGLIARAKAIAGKLSFIPAVRTQLMMLRAVEPVYGFTRGDATDQSLKAVYWAAGDYERLNDPDPDQSDSGLLFCLPIIPACGETVFDVVRDTRDHFAHHGFEAAITVNLMNTKAMEGVVSLAFDRRDAAQTAKAHACIQEMEARYMEQGYPPYRVGINSMHLVVHENDPFWRTVRDLKKVLDPNGIIAPGRYNLV